MDVLSEHISPFTYNLFVVISQLRDSYDELNTSVHTSLHNSQFAGAAATATIDGTLHREVGIELAMMGVYSCNANGKMKAFRLLMNIDERK